APTPLKRGVNERRASRSSTPYEISRLGLPRGKALGARLTLTVTVRASLAWNYVRNGLLILLTFHLVLLSWVFFRAANLSTALDTLRRIAVDHGPLFWDPIIVQGVLAIVLLGVLDLFHRRTGFWDALEQFPKWLRVG